MGILSKIFGNKTSIANYSNEDLINFQHETAKLLETSIKLLKANSDEGGFIKLFFDNNSSELVVVLTNSCFNNQKTHWGNDWNKYLCHGLIYETLSQDEVDFFLKSMKINVDDENAYESDVYFRYFYPYPTPIELSKKWFIDYLSRNHPTYSLSINHKDVSFIV